MIILRLKTLTERESLFSEFIQPENCNTFLG